MDQGHVVTAVAYLTLLALVFIGMAGVVLRMAQGAPSGAAPQPPVREAWTSIAPPLALGACILMLGVYVPAPLRNMLEDAARILGGM